MKNEENLNIDEKTLILLFQNDNDSDKLKDSEIFIQGVMKKVKQELLLRTIGLSVSIGICALILFPQVQLIAASFSSAVSGLHSNIPGAILEPFLLPFSVLTLGLISFILLDWSAD